jgi:hypothetical protein
VVDGSDDGWFSMGAFHISDAGFSSFAVAGNHLLITYCVCKTYVQGKERNGKDTRGKETSEC